LKNSEPRCKKLKKFSNSKIIKNGLEGKIYSLSPENLFSQDKNQSVTKNRLGYLKKNHTTEIA